MKKLLRALFPSKKKMRVIPAATHGVRNASFSRSALHAIKTLTAAGYEAYIVGGAIRDLLLGLQPKDFDIATNATAPQTKRLFGRRARIIGRRFRIVHLTYGSFHNREILEVTTFRADSKADKADKGAAARLAADSNQYGSASEDAHRRDFTMNALLYNPRNGEVVDYVGGYDDIQAKTLASIGPAKARLAEDPVRILRAVRLAAKLRVQIAPATARHFRANIPLLAEIPRSRLFDEISKVLLSGASAPIFRQWRQLGIARVVFPHLAAADCALFFRVLAETDKRQGADDAVSFSFIFAALFWPAVAAAWAQQRKTTASAYVAMQLALDASKVFTQNRIVPQKITTRIKQLYFLQAQMADKPIRRRITAICRNADFKRALAFLRLREDVGAAETAQWWTQYIAGDADEQAAMLQPSGKKRRRKRRGGKSTSSGGAA